MRSPMYRPSAMNRLSHPGQLDTEVRLVRPSGWVALCAVALVLVAFIVWCFAGTVTTTVAAPGVLATQYGTVNSLSPKAGHVAKIFVEQGDDVAAGAPLATVETASGPSTVLAGESGQVVEVLAYPSDPVDAGSTIVTIQPSGDELRTYAYVPVAESQPVKPGMKVQLSVTTVSPQEYGLLLGTVVKVGSHPATRAGVGALLNNDDITNIVVGSVPVFQVEVALKRADTPTGFAWTSGDGPPEPISAGTLVNATVITAVQAPITLLLPSGRSSG